jgi:hypothetical protein
MNNSVDDLARELRKLAMFGPDAGSKLADCALQMADALAPARAVIHRLGIFSEIKAERARQDAKWGEQNHPMRREDENAIKFFKTMSAQTRELCDALEFLKKVTWYDILIEEVFEVFDEGSPAKQRDELVQVIAVGVAMIECIDRKEGGK